MNEMHKAEIIVNATVVVMDAKPAFSLFHFLFRLPYEKVVVSKRVMQALETAYAGCGINIMESRRKLDRELRNPQ